MNPGIIDFHTHIFSRRLRENRNSYCLQDSCFRVLYESPKSKMAGATELIEAMDENHVAMSVVFGFPWRDGDTFKRENDYIMNVTAKHPNRLIGFACFDPFHEDAPAEAERCLRAGLKGVGELAFYDSDISSDVLDRLAPIMGAALNTGTPVLIHTNEPVGHRYPGKSPNTLQGIYALVLGFPENKIVLAHWGGGILFYELLKREVSEAFKNVYFDTAASPFLYHPKIYKIVNDIGGLDKILFGSDYPLIKPERYFREFETAGLTGDEIVRISETNAASLLNLSHDQI